MKKLFIFTLMVITSLTIYSLQANTSVLAFDLTNSPTGTVTNTLSFITLETGAVVDITYPSKIYEGEDLPIIITLTAVGSGITNLDKFATLTAPLGPPTTVWNAIEDYNFGSKLIANGDYTGQSDYMFDTSSMAVGASTNNMAIFGFEYDFQGTVDKVNTFSERYLTFEVVEVTGIIPITDPTLLPLGKNYVDEVTISTASNLFLYAYVEPNTTYTISTNMQSNLSVNVVIHNAYAMYPVIYGESTNSLEVLYNGITFTTPDVIDAKLKIYILADEDISQDIADSLQLEVGATKTSYESYIAYVETGDETIPIISGNSLFPVDVDSPVSISTIQASLTAVDETDGDLTSSIINTVDDYTANNDTLGDYLTTWQVTDGAGNIGEYNITVRVTDITKPSINLIGESTVYVEYPASYNEMGAVVTDNYDTGLTAVISGSVDTNTLGTYIVYYDVVDGSGNAATQLSRTVIVRDDNEDIPIITIVGDSTVYVEFGSNYSESGATALDYYNESVSVSITGSVNTGILDTYTVYYNAVDTEGHNALQVTRTVIVHDTTSPLITMSDVVTYNSLNELLSTVMASLSATDLYDGNITGSVIVTADTYTGNETTVGVYSVSFEVTDSNGNVQTKTITVTVNDDLAPVIEADSYLLTEAEFDSMTRQEIIDHINSRI